MPYKKKKKKKITVACERRSLSCINENLWIIYKDIDGGPKSVGWSVGRSINRYYLRLGHCGLFTSLLSEEDFRKRGRQKNDRKVVKLHRKHVESHKVHSEPVLLVANYLNAPTRRMHIYVYTVDYDVFVGWILRLLHLHAYTGANARTRKCTHRCIWKCLCRRLCPAATPALLPLLFRPPPREATNSCTYVVPTYLRIR